MRRFAGKLALGLAGAAALALSACSSLSVGTSPQLRAIDYANDDVANLVIAFDVPETLEPVQDASTLAFALGSKKLTTGLVRANADEVAGTLPPPAGDHTYYLFGFSDADKTKIRALQAEAKASPGAASGLVISFAPSFCRTVEIDPKNARFSVLMALPGATAGLAPLVSNASLADVLAATPTKTLPACDG